MLLNMALLASFGTRASSRVTLIRYTSVCIDECIVMLGDRNSEVTIQAVHGGPDLGIVPSLR